MQGQAIKRRLAQGESVIGTFVKCSDPANVEILALAGYDFFVLDNEHVMFNRETILSILRAASCSGIEAILRVRKNADIEILQLLDAGAPGLLVPQVNSASEARACTSYVKYPPEGTRGFAPTHRAARYGSMNPAEYARQANESTFLGCYCETKKAILEIEEIVHISGIDMVFIGPMDLSASYGVIGRPQEPVVQTAIQHVVEVCRQAKRPVGTIAANAQEAYSLLQQGYQFITISSDQGMLLKHAQGQLREIKACIEGGKA